MAEATINHRFVSVVGPLKFEFISATVSSTNTIRSNLQNPLYVGLMTMNVNTGSGTYAPQDWSLSGKTLTIDTNSSSSIVGRQINVMIVGF